MFSVSQSEVFAIKSLNWLLKDEDCVYSFLAQTGASMEDLRGAIGDPHFLGSVLDFIMTKDEWVIACAQSVDLSPDQFFQIRQNLPGGEIENWT